jgi:hypothetical protein
LLRFGSPPAREESVTVLTNQPSEDAMNDAFTPAIAANIQALASLLQQAAERGEEAAAAIAAGERNQAIGTIVGLDELLAAAGALHGAALALHRQ